MNALSVAIAGRYTGIYPATSPGGWHLLGTARGVRPFDVLSASPWLFSLGDRVRFRREESGMSPNEEPAREPPPSGVLEVVRCPAAASLQDLGRPGHQGRGVPRGGAWDVDLHVRTNRALGNEDNAATIELPLDRFVGRALGDLWLSIDGEPPRRFAAGETVDVPAGRGAIRYLGVEGGFAGDVVLGSRSTLLSTRIAGHRGRTLRPGDRLGTRTGERGACSPAPPVAPRSEAFRIEPGPQPEWFSPTAFEQMCTASDAGFVVSRLVDRTGTRLDGPKLRRQTVDNAAPIPMVRGAIQVSTDGTPIVLGPDAATTGGYPVVAWLIADDQSRFAQVRSGCPVRFIRA